MVWCILAALKGLASGHVRGALRVELRVFRSLCGNTLDAVGIPDSLSCAWFAGGQFVCGARHSAIALNGWL